MLLNLGLVFLISTLNKVSTENAETLEIGIKQGQLVGKLYKSRNGTEFYGFTGIPYSKPPVGDLRFEPPQEPNSWNGVLNATVLQNECVQKNLLPFGPAIISGSEDCLYLNVYTPKYFNKNVSLPVMVWIHGGAFSVGSGNHFYPTYLMDKSIVLITFNYRLGVLGFLSAGDETLPGNMALKDQLAALKWIQNNIKSFGGDPENVTVFGESAGAASVHLQLHSPLSKGLFKAAIAQSGSSYALWSLIPTKVARQRSNAFATLSGCPTTPTKELLRCLKHLPVEDLVKTHFKFFIWGLEPVIPFGPVVEPASDDAFLPKSPWEQNVVSSVPYLTGINSAEGAHYIPGLLLDNGRKMMELRNNYKRLLPLMLNFYYLSDNTTSTITDLILKFYLGDKQIGNESIFELITLFSDASFNYNTMRAALNHTNTVFFYYYDHRNKKSMNDNFNLGIDLGVSHGDELQNLFYVPILYPDELSEKDRNISERMIDYWVNFAYTNNPNGYGKSIWKPMTTNKEYLRIKTDQDVMETDFMKQRYQFWSNLSFFDGLKANKHIHEEL